MSAQETTAATPRGGEARLDDILARQRVGDEAHGVDSQNQGCQKQQVYGTLADLM